MQAVEPDEGVFMSEDHTKQRATGQCVRANRPSVNGWSAEYLDAEYQRFLSDAGSVPGDLRQFFQGFELGLSGTGAGAAVGSTARAVGSLDYRVSDLVEAFRARGHLAASIDPFGRKRSRPEELSLKAHGISDADLSASVDTPFGRMSVQDLVNRLEANYCGSIGAEFMHIPDEGERAWFLGKFESSGMPTFSAEQQKQLLEQLTAAEVFDKFLGKRYQGKKRFSLEGGESLIPFLKWMTQRVGELGTEEVIIGMAHRGRLSVLRNYLGKDLQRLFTEFEDSWSEGGLQGVGDVKYHRGYSGDQPVQGTNRSVHLSMLNNPSHLESVNALVMGKCRSKQDRTKDEKRERCISVLIHGDAAVAGQGVVAECLNMSQLEGYAVGGTIHAVTNNLVGFTTDPSDDRSTEYCTDIAKMVNCPVLHVNGDDPEAVVWTAMLAAEYRHTFRKDIFVDIVCFRRYGHNEQDEPGYTQPELTALVKAHPGTPETYRQKLLAKGVISDAVATGMVDRETQLLDDAQNAAKAKPVDPVPPAGEGEWRGIQGEYSFESPATAVDAKTIARVCQAMGTAPENFNVHPKLRALLASRAALPTTKKLSHADAEQIAIGTLLLDGTPVRMSGQDSRRGTFTQRHAVLRDEVTSERITLLNQMMPKQAMFSVWDSPLSEVSVMGFDYGYSRGSPGTLVMWEAQFGDFGNSAQVMVDQYLASSEAKWKRWAGLVLLMPHGYEGQGPEHSSARLERFLQLCADNNMEVVYPTTGAQLFHLLRRQMKRNFRKPLIVLTPKKYLRFEGCSIDDLSAGSFQHIIDDPTMIAAGAGAKKGVTQVVYCSGKLYHELHERREAIARKDIAIVRVEQLYPFHTKLAKQIDESYPKAARRVWAQEEPRNQGAFLYASDVFREQLQVQLWYVGRAASASPASGSEYAHKKQQEKIYGEAVGELKPAGGAEAKGKVEVAGKK